MMPVPMGAGWTDERVEQLKKLWKDGLSAAQIAKRLGSVTRNAVIGKAHRLGLATRAQPSAPRMTAPKERRIRLAKFVPPPVPKSEPIIDFPDDVGLATIATLERHMCKWPIGDPQADGFSLCGRPAEGTYCAVHAQRARDPVATARANKRARARKTYVESELRALQRWL